MTEKNVAIILSVLSGPDQGKTTRLEQDEILLGRKDPCDFKLSCDSAVSGKHAKIVHSNGEWTIEDLASKNGLYVESAGKPEQINTLSIKSGQIFHIGLNRVEVKVEAPPPIQLKIAPVTPKIVPQEEKVGASVSPPAKIFMRVSSSSERLKFQIFSGGAVGAEYSIPFSAIDGCNIRDRLKNVILYAHQYSATNLRLGKEVSAALKSIGDLFQYHLLPERIRHKLLDTTNADLLLMLKPSVLSLPWELVNLHDKPLCLSFNVSRQILADEQSILAVPDMPQKSPRILIVSTPTNDLPEAYHHAQELFRWLHTARPSIPVAFLAGSRVDRVSLLEHMSVADIVYFIGHADFDDAHPLNSGWRLETGRITCAEFQKIRRPPKFVFANGCGTGREADSTASSLIHGLASGFLLSGVQNYLGTIWDIPPKTAAAFARHLFAHLIKGIALGESVRQARHDVIASSSAQDPTWASYVLYGNPGCKLL